MASKEMSLEQLFEKLEKSIEMLEVQIFLWRILLRYIKKA